METHEGFTWNEDTRRRREDVRIHALAIARIVDEADDVEERRSLWSDARSIVRDRAKLDSLPGEADDVVRAGSAADQRSGQDTAYVRRRVSGLDIAILLTVVGGIFLLLFPPVGITILILAAAATITSVIARGYGSVRSKAARPEPAAERQRTPAPSDATSRTEGIHLGYSSPRAVAESDLLSIDERCRILRSWEYDIREIQVAEEEGMAVGRPSVSLTSVRDALRDLGCESSAPEADHKQGGSVH